MFLVVTTLVMIWAERRVVGRMQSRPGPNRVGPFGLLQSLADGVKLALKEDITPKAADVAVFVLAPIISATTCFIAFAVIPFGPTAQVPGTDITTPLQLTDLPVAVLYMLAIASSRRIRARPVGVVLRLDVPAAGVPALLCTGDQLRDRDEPGPGERVRVRRTR